jgi:hypothetical protein
MMEGSVGGDERPIRRNLPPLRVIEESSREPAGPRREPMRRLATLLIGDAFAAGGRAATRGSDAGAGIHVAPRKRVRAVRAPTRFTHRSDYLRLMGLWR